MRTVSQVVEEVIAHSPFLAEAIAEDVANNAKVARKIKGEVEKRLLEGVSEASIAMALHRLSRELQRPHFGMKYLARMNDVTVRGGLVQFVFPNVSEVADALEATSRSAQRKKGAFFTYSSGLHETVLIIGSELEADVRGILVRQKGLVRTDGLSAITMHLPEESLSVPGIYYPILKALALEGISIMEVLSVRTEFSVILEDKDVDRAFSAIKKITR